MMWSSGAFQEKKINIHYSLYLGLVTYSKESGSTAISAPVASMRIQQPLDIWAPSLQTESDHGHTAFCSAKNKSRNNMDVILYDPSMWNLKTKTS